MLYCHKCSTEYPEGKKFCKICGSSLKVRESVPPPADKSIGSIETIIEIRKDDGQHGKLCSNCGISYPPDKKFCKNCGGPLNEVEEAYGEAAKTEPAPIQRTQRRYCPSCGIEQESNKKFCSNCGTSLSTGQMEVGPFPQAGAKPFPEIKFTSPQSVSSGDPAGGILSLTKVKSLLRKKKKLLKTGGKVSTLITNLGAQQAAISAEALDITMKPYEAKLEAIEKEIRGIDTYLNGLQKKIRTESENLEKELSPFKNRQEELRTLRKAKGLTFGDYKRFKKGPYKACKQLGSQIRKRTKIMRILSSPAASRNFFTDPALFMKVGIVVLSIAFLGGGGFFGYTYFFKKENTNVPVSPSGQRPTLLTPAPTNTASASLEGEIKKVFDTIKQANMTEDINLFMTCYSTAFPNLEEKKDKTIQTWKDMDITGLAYTMRDLIVQQNTTEVTIEWQITTRAADGGQTETFNTTNNVVLQKEGDQWKIVNLK
jgi:rRNA maturation endonuclease Nob1